MVALEHQQRFQYRHVQGFLQQQIDARLDAPRTAFGIRPLGKTNEGKTFG
jgi:hypothetical protein